MPRYMSPLPILKVKNEFIHAVENYHRIVISAPTGTGKSTQIPQMLLDSCSLSGNILVLQPRRLAARMLASRVAMERQCPLGSEVGYMTRFDARHTNNTRLFFITEGILPRLIMKNPALTDFSAIVFDEFHERSIHSDMGIGMIRNLQDQLRPDLIVTIMSATIDRNELGAYLGAHHLVECPQRQYPVTIRYEASRTSTPVWDAAANGLTQLLSGNHEGDVLIFMPGVYEIRKTIERCKAVKTGEKISFFPLYGELSADQQDEVMAPCQNRKVIVATNIAETSLTIPGVRHVIDSGLARVNRYEPGRGLNALLIEPISKDSTQQRSGRAGRIDAGICIRLWTEKEQARRPDFHDPEIKRIDLAEPLLTLLYLGFKQPERSFPWLTPPSAITVNKAWELLHQLGAIRQDDSGLTPLGKAMAELPAHPRLSRLLLEAQSRQCVIPAAMIAGIISERTILLSEPAAQDRFFTRFEDRGIGKRTTANGDYPRSDLFAILKALDYARQIDFDYAQCNLVGMHAAGARQVWRTADYYRKMMNGVSLDTNEISATDATDLLQSLLVGFPDHLIRRRDFSSRICFLRDGKRGELTRTCEDIKTNLLLALEIREIGNHQGAAKIKFSLISEMQEEWLIDLYPDAWEFEHVITWNDVKKGLEKRSLDRCLGLIINEKITEDIDPEVAGRLLSQTIREKNIALTGWNKEVNQYITRVHWVAEQFPERHLLCYDEAVMSALMEELCYGETRLAAVQQKSCLHLVQNRLSYDVQQFIAAMAPEFIKLPSGRSLKLKYQEGQLPKGNAKIQDLYGLATTPTVAGGRQKVLLEILGPNFRPVQITDDLAGFWQILYPQIKKDLMRRYPKHEWR